MPLRSLATKGHTDWGLDLVALKAVLAGATVFVSAFSIQVCLHKMNLIIKSEQIKVVGEKKRWREGEVRRLL